MTSLVVLKCQPMSASLLMIYDPVRMRSKGCSVYSYKSPLVCRHLSDKTHVLSRFNHLISPVSNFVKIHHWAENVVTRSVSVFCLLVCIYGSCEGHALHPYYCFNVSQIV